VQKFGATDEQRENSFVATRRGFWAHNGEQMRLLLGLIVHVSQHLGEETGQLQFAHQNILDTATSHLV